MLSMESINLMEQQPQQIASVPPQQIASVNAFPPQQESTDFIGTSSSQAQEDLGMAPQQAKITPDQLRQLNAQVAAYKLLARNEPLPRQLLNQAAARHDNDSLPLPYEYPLELPNGEKLPYDLSKVLAIHQQRASNRTTSLPMPVGIDPELIWRERENRFFKLNINRIFLIKIISQNPKPYWTAHSRTNESSNEFTRAHAHSSRD